MHELEFQFFLEMVILLSFFQGKEEVMAVRLREADSMAAMAELRQKIAELEIQVRNIIRIYSPSS